MDKNAFMEIVKNVRNRSVKTAFTHLTDLHVFMYIDHLKNWKLFESKRTIPEFDMEERTNWKQIWKVHVDQVIDVKSPTLVESFLTTVKIKEALILLGQRFTPGSITTELALPPEKTELITAFLEPYNAEITKGVRAWEKHIDRYDQFWGVIIGTPKERELAAIEKVNEIFENMTWWNTFEHYKHGAIYEIREPGGHGLRWQLNPLKFVGFVEPFTTDYE